MLTIPDIIEQYGVTKTTLYKWINKGLFKALTKTRGRMQREYLIDPVSWRSFWEARMAMPKYGNGRRLPPKPETPPSRIRPLRPSLIFEAPPMKGDRDYKALQAQALTGHRKARTELQAANLTRWWRAGHGWVIGGEA